MIINLLESLIASYFFTNYFDLKINKYVYFIINANYDDFVGEEVVDGNE